MHDNLFDIEPRTGEFAVTLSIGMQQFLDLYVEPDPDDETTWEDEEKLFVLGPAKLEELTNVARDKAKELLQSALDVQTFERAGATFHEVSRIQARRNGHEFSETTFEDEPFQADEDMAFLLYFASALYSFIFEANSLLDPPVEVVKPDAPYAKEG